MVPAFPEESPETENQVRTESITTMTNETCLESPFYLPAATKVSAV